MLIVSPSDIMYMVRAIAFSFSASVPKPDGCFAVSKPVRAVISLARRLSTCVVFIDELDAASTNTVHEWLLATTYPAPNERG